MHGTVAKTLTLIGDNWLGRLFAGLLLYIVAGSIAGSVLAVRTDKIQCWPTSIFYTVTVECPDAIEHEFWWYTVGLPNQMLGGPVRAVVILTSDYELDLFNVDLVVAETILVALITFFGFAAWHARAPPMAWLLMFALMAEIVYLRLLVPDVCSGPLRFLMSHCA